MRAGDVREELHYFVVYLKTETTFEVITLLTGTGEYAVELIEREKRAHSAQGKGIYRNWGVSFSPAFVSIHDLEAYLRRNCYNDEEYARELHDLRHHPNYPKEQ